MSENPYEAPTQAEVQEARKPRRLKPLPVVSIALILLMLLVVSAGLAVAVHPLWAWLFGGACIATLVFMVCYDLYRWTQ